MDEDKIILVHPGFWDGSAYRNGDEVLVFTSLRTVSFKDFLDDVHKIVQADRRIFDYVLHYLTRTEDYGVMKSIIMSDCDLQRVARIFKTPKIYVSVMPKHGGTGASFYGNQSQGPYGAPTPFGYFPCFPGAGPNSAPYFQAPCFPGAWPNQAGFNQPWPNQAQAVKPNWTPAVNQPKPSSTPAVNKPKPMPTLAENKTKPIPTLAASQPKPSDKPRVPKRALEIEQQWPSTKASVPQVLDPYPWRNKRRTNGLEDNAVTSDDDSDEDSEDSSC